MKLFDLDGTLIDSNGIWVEVDLAFLGRLGLEPTEEYSHTVGHSIFPIAAQFTRDYYHLDLTAEEIMSQWLRDAGDAYAHVAMKPGAMAFLARCREEGQRMAMVTACVPDLCRTALTAHGLDCFFEDILFVQDLGMEKRNPKVFEIAARRLGLSPAECTLYEDGPANCRAARETGMEVVGVYDPFYDAYQAEMAQICHRYIRSFNEL